MKRTASGLPNWRNKRQRQGSSNGGTPLASAVNLKSALPTPATSDSDIPRPRVKHSSAANTDIESTSFGEDSDSSAPPGRATSRKVRRELSYVAIQGPASPLSAYEGKRLPAEQFSEFEAVDRLTDAHEKLLGQDEKGPEFVYFQLDDFCVYRPPTASRHELELVSLDRLSQDRYPEFLFDGVLSVGDERCYVEAEPFRVLTVEGYGQTDSTDLAIQLCIQSRNNEKKRSALWYKLGKPSVEYRRFYTPFLWLARFTKHFVDYLDETEQVTLHHFWHRFHKWLVALYHDNKSFESWLSEAGLTDFRTTVAAHFAFLYKECYGLDFKLCKHPIWGEIDPGRLKAIPEQPNLRKRTVVTPYAYECFRSMYFGDQLEKESIAYGVNQSVLRRKERLRLTPRYREKAAVQTPLSLVGEDSAVSEVSSGDVVCVRPDTDAKWKSKANVWFAYVQNVRYVVDRTLLDVLWLYQSGQTTIGRAYYPFQNELFLSDHCECGETALDLDCVVEKVEVSWFAHDPYAEKRFFVRQKYRTVAELDTYDFVALHESDFTCHCDHHITIFDQCKSKHSPGDTVLIRQYSKALGEDRLQPAQIFSYDEAKMRVHLRVLLRKSEIDPTSGARPNELVLTDEIIDKAPSMVIRKCHVRFSTQQQVATGDIVTPYDRDGAGDFWFIAGEPGQERIQSPGIDTESGVDETTSIPALNQGWDPTSTPSKPKLTGMGIFCGGGTFDRGLEEGGAVKFRYAVDWAEQALHSYRANVRRPRSVQYFLGSVDDYLAKAMAGHHKDCIARVGDVHIISAGSPCPGFSTLQSDRNSEQSRRNASMVASVVSFVDLYVPEYLILENVVNMTYSSAGPKKDQNVFSQILAALVGLGYQVQQFLMDAWSHGSSQNRSRVFIVASAPGLPPLRQPNHSHAHPVGISTRALGNTDNSLRFGNRRWDFTPFQHVSAAASVSDLPHIGDSQPQICPQFPDHRTATMETNVNRGRMAAVPVRPTEMGLIQARDAGALHGEPLEYCARVNRIRSGKNSKMYKRIGPNRLFPTIITKCLPQGGVAGQYVHWDQHRVITIMEAKRAQGFLDGEVLIGTYVHQMKIVGNSVDRKVALVLGLGLRESWMASHGVIEEAPAAAGALQAKERLETQDDKDMEMQEREENAQVSDGESYATAEESSPAVNDRDIDNRTAKIALLDLTPERLDDIRANGFKAINRIFAENAAEDVRAGGARAGGGEVASSP